MAQKLSKFAYRDMVRLIIEDFELDLNSCRRTNKKYFTLTLAIHDAHWTYTLSFIIAS